MKLILVIVFVMLILPLLFFQINALEVIKQFNISEENGNPSDGLIQPNLAAETTITSNEYGEIIFKYSVPESHSCDVKISVYVDGVKRYTTGWMGNHQKITNSLPLDSGIVKVNAEPNKLHTIKFIPESRDSGPPCTATNFFTSWYGTVEFFNDKHYSNSGNIEFKPTSTQPSPSTLPPDSLPKFIQDNWFLFTVVGTILGIIAALTTIIKNVIKK